MRAFYCMGNAASRRRQTLSAFAREVRQLLLDARDIGPRVLLQAREPLVEVEQCECVRRKLATELFPRDRRRDRRARPRPRRIGDHRGRAPPVTQIVEAYHSAAATPG